MAQIVIRKLDDAVKERLKRRAHEHGRSMEEEARVILQEALPARARTPQKGWATQIVEEFKGIGFTDEEIAAMEQRGQYIRPADFE